MIRVVGNWWGQSDAPRVSGHALTGGRHATQGEAENRRRSTCRKIGISAFDNEVVLFSP